MGEKQWTPTQPQLASPEDPDHTRWFRLYGLGTLLCVPSMCLCQASEGPQMHELV